MSDHIVTSFDQDLRALRNLIAEMGGYAEKSLVDSVDALLKRDIPLAQRVIALDGTIDSLQHTIEERAILIIAKRQPMALDLREIVSAIRVSNDLERIGDLSKNIAKRVVALNGQMQPTKFFGGFDHMADLVLEQLKQVLDAYAQRNQESAAEVWRSDGAIDAMYTSLFRELLTYMMEDPRNIGFCTHLLFCAKNIERIGDHATNIAETVHYLVSGEVLAGERPKNDSSSFTSIEYPNNPTNT
ncbi:MAG: phosphate signaling complex protein PhoU [Allorhizobium sp.]